MLRMRNSNGEFLCRSSSEMELSIFPISDHEIQCGYFPDRTFISENFYAHDFNREHLDILLARGYRHFGTYFFRPACGTCSRCIPIRVPLKGYVFTKSARRILNKNSDLRIVIGESRL